MQPTFIHLRLHSEFSLVDGIVKIKPLVKRLLELNMPAVAITEHSNLFSLVKFYKATIGQGIKPIAGADVLIINPDDPATPYYLTLLVNNNIGYVTLTELISKAYQEGQHQGVPMLKLEWLIANHAGLIALSGAMAGDIGKALLADNVEAAKRQAVFWANLFPDSFYLELQRVGKPDEERYIAAALDLAVELDLPVVATNDVRFLHSKDFAAHEVRVCINQSRVLDDDRRPKEYTDQQYLRSAEEMAELFADIPEALANTVAIAQRCNLSLTLGKNFLPDYPVPEGMTLSEVMSLAALQGLEERLQHSPAVGKGTDEENRRVYYDRLDFELKMITQMGFPGYFMIVADFIQWAKNHGIPVGPGRGSGAGSLVAYALKITDLDPIEFDLLFERFLNPERVSMPDFDIDFCMDRRDEVIQYVADHYGRDHVAQIITYGSMAAKAVIRDVGRVLGFGYGFVDRLAKLVPFEIGMTLDKALKDSPELKQLYDTEEEVKTLINMALSLEGTVRNAGKHAGGVVISPTKLTDFTALYCEEDGSNLVTQFDKSDVESVGLVKFDFLGLRTLTIIDWALQDINAKQQSLGKPLVDITLIPRDDAASYSLLKNGDTTAVFQLESRGMKELIKKLRPDCFDDIIALVALFRPGPLESGMVDDYVNVKHKRQKAEYAHPLLEPILKPTNGVILYQEQVMQIAREMALYTLGGADILRRCLSGSTQIIDVATGQCVSLQEVADNADYWLGRDVFSLDLHTQKIVTKPITAIYPNGVRDVWEVTTKTNRKIRATSDHLFYTISGWQALAEFNVGDSIGLARTLPIENESNISDAQIKLTAYLIGDGHLCTKRAGHSYFCNSDNALIEDFNQCSLKLFGKTAPLDYQYHQGRKSVCYVRIGMLAEFKQWIDTHIKRAHSRDKKILTWVYELSPTHTALFLGTLWSTDGSFDTGIGHTDYTSTAVILIKQIQHLLLRLGIVALFNIKTITYKNQPHISYRAQITGREEVLKFCMIIMPFLSGYKTEKALLCYERVKDKLQNQSKHQLPSAVINLISESKQVSGMTWSEIDAAVGVNKGVMSGGLNFTRPRQKLSRHRVRHFAEALQDKRLLAIAESEVFWDDIVSIEFIGEEAVFDLTIPETHNFIANDFIAHNCMGKKDAKEMANQREFFIKGALSNQVSEEIASYVFDLVDKFSGYGFNKSHSAAYALVAYQTAWLKAHYPAEFMAAVLSSDMDNTDKVVILIEECRHMKLKILPPNINVSKYKFTVNAEGQIIYGLGALKGVGGAAIEDMIKEREENGLFSGLYDLCKRVDLRKFNRRVLEVLIRAGAFDEFDDNRAAHAQELATALRIAEQHGKMVAAGQNDLFGLAVSDEAAVDDSQTYTTAVVPWSAKERLNAEKLILGLYLTGHPIDYYAPELKDLGIKNIGVLLTELERSRGGMKVRVAGLAIDINVRQNKQGKSRGTAILDDNTGRLEITAYNEAFDNYQGIFARDYKDALLIAEGTLAIDEYMNVPRLKVDKLYSMDQAREVYARSIALTWMAKQQADGFIAELNAALTPFKGGRCPVSIDYSSERVRATLQLGEAWRVHPTDELLVQLKTLFTTVDVRYK